MAQATPEEDDNELCKFLREHNVPQVVLSALIEDDININDILEYSDEDLKEWCKEHKIKIAPSKKFMKAVNILKQSKNTGKALSNSSLNDSQSSTNNVSPASKKDQSTKKTDSKKKKLDTDLNEDRDELFLKLFQSGCVGCSVEFLSQIGAESASLKGIYAAFAKLWEDYDVPLIAEALKKLESNKDDEKIDIDTIYEPIIKSFRGFSDFYLNLGRLSWISCFKSSIKDCDQLKQFLAKHLGSNNIVSTQWLALILMIQKITDISVDIEFILDALEAGFEKIFSSEANKKELNEYNDLLKEVNSENKEDSTERTFAKMYVKQAMALSKPDDTGSVFKITISDNGTSLAIGGKMTLTKKQILLKALEIDKTYWPIYQLLAKCLTADNENLYVLEMGFVGKTELLEQAAKLKDK